MARRIDPRRLQPLGVFIFSPWLFALAYEPARVDAWTTGLILIAISLGALVAFAEWEEWVSLILGVWMVASLFVLNFPHGAGMKISIGVGCVVT